MTIDPARPLVWDWTLRLFHWMIVLIIPMMWWTAEQGMMDWHRRFGLLMLGLVIYRIVWGIIGAWTARFRPMLRNLTKLPAYVRGLLSRKPGISFGHSPIGTLSVFALLLSLTVQVSTGLFSVDVDGLESGPLAVLVSFDTGRDIADIHELNFNILLGLIALHVAAIVIYRTVLGDRLIKPMVTGHREPGYFGAKPLPDNRARPWSAVTAFVVASACVYAAINAGWQF